MKQLSLEGMKRKAEAQTEDAGGPEGGAPDEVAEVEDEDEEPTLGQ